MSTEPDRPAIMIALDHLAAAHRHLNDARIRLGRDDVFYARVVETRNTVGTLIGLIGSQEPALPRMGTCARCGANRRRSDLAQHDEQWFCHPSWSTGRTCYMAATQETP